MSYSNRFVVGDDDENDDSFNFLQDDLPHNAHPVGVENHPKSDEKSILDPFADKNEVVDPFSDAF